MKRIIILAVLAAIVLVSINAGFAKEKAAAQPQASPAATAAAAPAKEKIPQFKGTISAFDTSAKTFTVGSKEKARVFKVTDQTKITKAGAPAGWDAFVVGEEVRGSAKKVAEGQFEAVTVKLGPKTEAEKAKSATKKAKDAVEEAAKPAKQ